MQNVQFKSIAEFLEFLPPDERAVVDALRGLVSACLPDATERLSYNVPYFRKRRNICFIWPASVLWGKAKTYDGVRFGFTSGHLLSDTSYLIKGSRKQVYWREFRSVDEIDAEQLSALLYEAALVDGGLRI